MGPRRYRRGNRFVIETTYHTDAASMGPRRYRRGNGDSVDMARIYGGLQWGHDVTVAEIHRHMVRFHAPKVLQWGHDVTVAEIVKGLI